MAALTITATDVLHVSGTVNKYTAGETITAGQVLYLKSSDSKVYKADNATSVEATTIKGIAMSGAAAGQLVLVSDAAGNYLDPGATLVVGETYVVGTTAGSIEPIADLATTEYVSLIGFATAADRLYLLNYSSGIQHA